MLSEAVESYLTLRHACGFELKSDGNLLRSFAAFSDARGECYVCSIRAVEWAGLSESIVQRARRLGVVIRFARHVRAEDERHEVPLPVFGREKPPRPVPYILSSDDVRRLVQEASQSGYRSLRRRTYSTLFALLSCTGIRVSEAIRLRFDDITQDGLVIRCSKFRSSRIVPLHATARAGLTNYLEQRRSYAPFDDHVFISLRRKPLRIDDVESAFRTVAIRIGLPCEPGLPSPTPHSLRHTFAVRALESCPDGRDRIAKHMLALSTYLGHSTVSATYWYLDATPYLMRDIAERCESFVTGVQS
jgi:integrase/recombinase XerD